MEGKNKNLLPISGEIVKKGGDAIAEHHPRIK